MKKGKVCLSDWLQWFTGCVLKIEKQQPIIMKIKIFMTEKFTEFYVWSFDFTNTCI